MGLIIVLILAILFVKLYGTYRDTYSFKTKKRLLVLLLVIALAIACALIIMVVK